jgi:hypothetical protein
MSTKKETVLEPPAHHRKGAHEEHEEREREQRVREERGQEQQEPSLIVTPEAPIVTPFAGSLPPLLGLTPTSVAQLQRNIPGVKGSHFTGPVVSGPAPGAGAVSGTGACALTLLLDYTMGNFSIPVAFPPGSFIYSWLSVCFAPFVPAAGPLPVAFTMGTTSGATDIFNNGSFGSALGELDQNITGSLPLWNAVSPQVPFQAWLNVTNNTGGPAGQGLIALFFIRLALPWG